MQPTPRTPEQRQHGLITARILLEIEAVNIRPAEPFIFTAGWASPVYIDCRKLISFPRARRQVIEMAAQAVEREIGYESLDAVAGGETAGIPYAAWLADRMALPMLYVRKKAKGFGRKAQIEGDFANGARTLLVEDLASDGGSKITFCKALRDAGAQCTDALVVFYYDIFEHGLKSLEDMGLRLHFLGTWWDILEVAETSGRFDPSVLREVRAFLENPVGWSAAHGGRSSLEG